MVRSGAKRCGTSRTRRGSWIRNQFRKLGRINSRAVAGDAPLSTTCRPSKNSAEYSGYETIAANPGERAENGLGPLPAVADQVVNAPRAGARGTRAGRHRLPRREVEVAVRHRRGCRAPRIRQLDARRRTECGAMELRFGRQATTLPARIGGGFGLAHIDRPRPGQRDVLEHAAPPPLAILLHPERRMRHGFPIPPFPARVVPPLAALIAAVGDEMQEVGVGHAVRIDVELGHRRPGARRTRCPSRTECGRARRRGSPIPTGTVIRRCSGDAAFSS